MRQITPTYFMRRTVGRKACFGGHGWRAHKRRQNDFIFVNFMLLMLGNANLKQNGARPDLGSLGSRGKHPSGRSPFYLIRWFPTFYWPCATESL